MTHPPHFAKRNQPQQHQTPRSAAGKLALKSPRLRPPSPNGAFPRPPTQSKELGRRHPSLLTSLETQPRKAPPQWLAWIAEGWKESARMLASHFRKVLRGLPFLPRPIVLFLQAERERPALPILQAEGSSCPSLSLSSPLAWRSAKLFWFLEGPVQNAVLRSAVLRAGEGSASYLPCPNQRLFFVLGACFAGNWTRRR